MRLFVALLFDADLQAQVASQRQRLLEHDPRGQVRWVDPSALHLTLRFIGEEPDSRVDEWVNRLTEALRGREAPVLGAATAGAFPNLARPRILWLGLREHGKRLAPLQAAVEDAARALGSAAERRAFQPHVTLGRVRARREPAPAVLPEALRRALTAIRAAGRPEPQSQVALMQSRLAPSGASYEALHRWELRSNDPR